MTMRKLQEKIKKKIKEIDSKIIEREITFEQRSDFWQTSQKGLEFLDKNDALQNVKTQLEEAVYSIDNYFEK